MARRRMFSLDIADTDKFLDLSISAQALYFHLGLRADDDGFIASAKKIQRMLGCGEDDLMELEQAGYIIKFDSGIIVIAHWKMHNYLRKDRHQETVHQEEAKKVYEKEDGAYTLENTGIPLGNHWETQERKGKERKEKERKGKSSCSCETEDDNDDEEEMDGWEEQEEEWDEEELTEEELEEIRAYNEYTSYVARMFSVKSLDELKKKSEKIFNECLNEVFQTVPPDRKILNSYGEAVGIDGEKFHDYYQANGWTIKGSKIYDWNSVARGWMRRDKKELPDELDRKIFVNAEVGCFVDDLLWHLHLYEEKDLQEAVEYWVRERRFDNDADNHIDKLKRMLSFNWRAMADDYMENKRTRQRNMSTEEREKEYDEMGDFGYELMQLASFMENLHREAYA